MSVAITAALFLVLTIVSWRIVSDLEKETVGGRFDARVSEVVLRIEARLADYEQLLTAAAAFMQASESVSRAEWRKYAGALQLHKNYPGIQALGFARQLRPAELPAHIAAVRAEGIPDYRVWPPGARDEYTAILYLEPMNERTRGALGHDMFADPVRREALVQARDTGKPGITRKVTLLRETGPFKQAGLLMYLPYFPPGRPVDTPEARRAALTGYVYVPIRMNDFIRSALGAELEELDLEIYDGSAPAPAALLYDSDPDKTHHLTHAPLFQRSVPVSVYGQSWHLRAVSLPGVESRIDSRTPLTVLLSGLLITVLAAVAASAHAVGRERSASLADANRQLVAAIDEQRAATAALSTARQETQRILESITDAFFALDNNWRFTYLNPKAEELLKRGSGELMHRNIWDEFPEAVNGTFYRQYHRARDERITVRFVEWYEPLQAWFEVRAYPHSSGISVFFSDITRRMQRDEALRLRERALESSVNAIVITDCLQPDNPIIYMNPAFERITGYSAAETLGRNCRFLQGPDREQPDLEKLRTIIREGGEGRVVLRNYHKSGDLFWNELFVAPVRDDDGRITHFVGVLNDISEARNYQNELERRATHDLLTGLANRGLLMDRLQLGAMQAKRRGQKIAVLFIDLDGFKMINDVFGHATGDQVLRLAGNRLAANVRQGDTAARLGGDEFVVVLNDQERIEDVSEAVQRIMDAILRPIPIQHHEITLTCSIGISVCPDDSEDAESLLKFADIAMYKAKEEGKNASRFYTRGMNDVIVKKATLTNNLRRALERREFLLHYQPQVDLKTDAVVGAEALIRWQHPEFGLVSPAQFIPLAEESGQIVHIGDWVMRAACAWNMAARRHGAPPLLMSVNLSARQLRDKNLILLIRGALEESGLPADALELEITESMVMTNVASVLEILNGIKALGVRLAMDDFGTGYSSLSYLKRFPIDRLKIDKSFVRDVTTDSNDAALTRTIISLAHNLGIKVIAEGVETREQADFLVQAGCDQAQGYYYGKPVDAAEFQRLSGNAHRLGNAG